MQAHLTVLPTSPPPEYIFHHSCHGLVCRAYCVHINIAGNFTRMSFQKFSQFLSLLSVWATSKVEAATILSGCMTATTLLFLFYLLGRTLLRTAQPAEPDFAIEACVTVYLRGILDKGSLRQTNYWLRYSLNFEPGLLLRVLEWGEDKLILTVWLLYQKIILKVLIGFQNIVNIANQECIKLLKLIKLTSKVFLSTFYHLFITYLSNKKIIFITNMFCFYESWSILVVSIITKIYY